MIQKLRYGRVAQGYLTPTPPQVGSRTGAVLESPFPAPASSNAACGFPALRFLCYFHLKGYGTYRTGSTFRPGSDELRNHYTIPEFHITKPYSICSSRSHGVFWHTSDVVWSFSPPNLWRSQSTYWSCRRESSLPSPLVSDWWGIQLDPRVGIDVCETHPWAFATRSSVLSYVE